jgi:hypothetical protein
MSEQLPINDEILSLKLGQAYITFGREAVDACLREDRWTEKYPELIARASGPEDPQKYDTILPGEIIYTIAGTDAGDDKYFDSQHGERLYARNRHLHWPEPRAIDVEIERQNLTLIPTQQALLTYGAYCLFMATDNIYGQRGERDPQSSSYLP